MATVKINKNSRNTNNNSNTFSSLYTVGSSNIASNITSAYTSLSNYITLDDYVSSVRTSDVSAMKVFLSNVKLQEYQIRALLASKDTAELVDVDILSENQTLSMHFIKDYFNKFKPSSLCKYQNVDSEFIEEHFSEFKDSITALSLEQHLTLDLIEKHKDALRWDCLARNTKINIDYDFVIKYIDLFSNEDGLQFLSSNTKITDDDFNKIISDVSYDILDKFNWVEISYCRHLTEENIFNNIDRLDFTSPLLLNRDYENEAIPVFMKFKYGYEIEGLENIEDENTESGD